MIESYVLQSAEDLNEIEKLGDDFIIFIMNGRYVCYYLYPSQIFINTFYVYDNHNININCYDSLFDAVKFCFNSLLIKF